MPDSLINSSLAWVEGAAGFLQRSDLPDELRLSSELVPASVLIPLFLKGNKWHVLFIRRVANKRDRHSGQVAFPGGRRDPEDTDNIATAVREAHEEVGLAKDDIKVLHTLPEYLTSSSYVVTPVVGIVPHPYEYQAQPTEVDKIFSIPLQWLADQNNVELRDKRISRGEQSGILKVVYYNEYDSEVLWGASARMTISLLKALSSGELTLKEYENQ